MNSWLIRFTVWLLERLLRPHILEKDKTGKLGNLLSGIKVRWELGLNSITLVGIQMNVSSKFARLGGLSTLPSWRSGKVSEPQLSLPREVKSGRFTFTRL